jgi:hypothetical protein
MRSYLVVALAAVSLAALDSAARSANDWSLSAWHAGPRSQVAYEASSVARTPTAVRFPPRWREARRIRVDRPRAEPARSYRSEHPTRPQCADRVRGLGTQWIGEGGALEAAKKDWMERVRYDLGESYLDLSHATDLVKRCGRTSIGETAGQVLFRCEIWARPCKGVFEPEGGR